MTLHEDPPRWLDADSPADPMLREMLRMASTNAPTTMQLQALAVKVSAATAATAGVGLGMKLQALVGKAGATKVSVVLLLGGALWGAQHLWLARAPALARQSATLPRSEAPVVAAPLEAGTWHRRAATVPVVPNQDGSPAAAVAPAQRSVPSESVVTPARASLRAQRSAPSAASASAPRRVPATRGAASLPVEPTAALASAHERQEPRAPMASELELLGRAQGLLAKDPDDALQLLDAVARAYPAGAFTEEREALAIDALRRLGRSGEMRSRGRAFLERYPASPHRDRIRTWLE